MVPNIPERLGSWNKLRMRSDVEAQRNLDQASSKAGIVACVFTK